MPIIGGRQIGVRGLGFQGAGKPNAPTSVSATDVGTARAFNNGAATVSWTAPSSNGAPITSYTVTSSPGSFTATTSSTSVQVTGLQSNTSYTFTVTATNAVGTSDASSASSSITATTVPQAPTIGTATGGNAFATVTYTAGATGGKAVSVFTATSSPGSLTGTGSSPITVSGLSNGTAYTFTVTATNANGTSAASAASNSVTPVSIYFFTQSNNTDITTGRVGTDTTNNRTLFAGGYSVAYMFPISSSGDVSAGISIPTQVSSEGQTLVSGSNVYLTGAGGSGNFDKIRVLKLNSSLGITWQRQLTSAQANMYASNLVIGDSDAVYVGGSNQTAASPPNYQPWIAKWNSSGTLQWYKEMGNSYTPGSGGQMRSLAWNGSSLIVSSSFQADSEGGQQPVFTRISADGNTQVAYPVSYTFLSMRANGSTVYGAGDGGNMVSINSTATPPTANWIRSNGASVDGVTVDSSGNVYWIASVSSPFNQLEIYKFNSSGTLQWQRSFRDSTANVGLFNSSISIGAEGQIFARFIMSGNYKWSVLAVNPDGSGTGTYSLNSKSWIYAASSRTITTPSTPIFTGATNQYTNVTRTEGAASLATSAYTLTATKVGI
jgi:hypothetical protein